MRQGATEVISGARLMQGKLRLNLSIHDEWNGMQTEWSFQQGI